MIKKVKKFKLPPQGVDQLLHVDPLWGVDKNTFVWFIFEFFVDFRREHRVLNYI